jgi:uncharacterized protein YjbI with pentapeptide repeats
LERDYYRWKILRPRILRYANHIFRKSPGGVEFEGGSGITYWGASSPIIRGNIIYGNTHNLEIRGLGNPVIENNVIAFGQKRGEYFGGANGIRTWDAEGTPLFKNNLVYRNWWGIEFNWGSGAIFKNNVVIENDVGLVIWQGDPGETKAHPVVAFNNVWKNGIDYSAGSVGTGHGHAPPGENDVSLNPAWTEKNFWNADFLLKNPVFKDGGDPGFTDSDGSRSDIGPNWDWSWVKSNQLRQQSRQTAEDLKLIKAKLDGLAGSPGVSVQLAEDLKTLSDRVSAVASSAREADFRASDFSRSHFGQGNFTEASFEGALIARAWLKDAAVTNSILDGVDFAGSRFEGTKFGDAILDRADFRGADLSGVLIDSETLLPN